MEQFRATGKSREELEKEAKTEILKNKVTIFIDDNKDDIAWFVRRQGKLGMLDIDVLARKFDPHADDEKIIPVRELLARILKEKNFKLDGAVVRSEIRGEDGVWCAEQIKNEAEKKAIISDKKNMTKEEIEEARAKLPPHQRGIPNSDL